MIKVFVVDDHSIVREGAKRIIAETADIEVAGEASDGREALMQILNNDYDVILLDIALPGMDGLEVLRTVRAKKPNLPVVILSMYPEEQYAARVLKEGAFGYVTKGGHPKDLLQAIRNAARRRHYISESFAESIACGLVHGDKKPHELLSTREYAVFRMIALGKSTKAIAHELALAPSTISTYRIRILEKMNMKSTAELVHYAVQNNLIY
jgi:two-component system, NarL family, invasion response regulator UvrY